MNLSFRIIALLICFCAPSITRAEGPDSPPSKAVGNHPAAARTPIYAGRTFEEWRRISLDDLDPETRHEAFTALAAFGRHGRDKEAVAAIQAALAASSESGESTLRLTRVYEAIKSLGDAGEPLFVAAVRHPSLIHQRYALLILQDGREQLPGEALTAALLERVQDKKVPYTIRNMACRALGRQVAYRQTLARRQAEATGGTATKPPPSPPVTPRIEPFLKQVVPVLEQTLKDNDPRVCEGAAVALLFCIKQRPALVATVLDYLDSELTSPREIPAAESAANSSGDPFETARIARRNELLQRRELARRAAIPADAFDEAPAVRVAPRDRANNEWSSVAPRIRGGFSTRNTRTDLYSELNLLSRTYREEMLPALPQLKSLRDRHPQARSQLEQVIQTLQPEQPVPTPRTEFAKPIDGIILNN